MKDERYSETESESPVSQMHVRLLIHLERVPDETPQFVWWAEADDIEGFSAAADHLPDLMTQAQAALAEIIGTDLEIAYVLASGDPSEDELEGAGLSQESGEPVAVSPRVVVPV